jgi:hypothetical protein
MKIPFNPSAILLIFHLQLSAGNHIVLEVLWTQAGSSLITSRLNDAVQFGFGFEQIHEREEDGKLRGDLGEKD